MYGDELFRFAANGKNYLVDEVGWCWEITRETDRMIETTGNNAQALADYCISMRSELAAMREVVRAADTLRQKMKTVYETAAYREVWAMYSVHGGKYPSDGAHDWISEQEAFDAARAKVTLP